MQRRGIRNLLILILMLTIVNSEHQDCMETMILFLSLDQLGQKAPSVAWRVLVTVTVLMCTRVISQTRVPGIHVLLHSPL